MLPGRFLARFSILDSSPPVCTPPLRVQAQAQKDICDPSPHEATWVDSSLPELTEWMAHTESLRKLVKMEVPRPDNREAGLCWGGKVWSQSLLFPER